MKQLNNQNQNKLKFFKDHKLKSNNNKKGSDLMRYIKFLMISVAAILAFNSYATSIESHLQRCVGINNNNQRLACYDAIVQVNKKKSSKAVVEKHPLSQVIAKSNRIVVAPTATPLNKIQLTKQFGQKAKPQQMAEQVEFTIKLAKLNARKKWRLTFENGQVWQAKESGLLLKAGSQIVIKRGALNSFLLKKKGANRSIRVKRIK